MRVWISGGSGFVGSYLVRAFDDVCAPAHAEVDVTDAGAVRRSVEAYAPDAIVHAAILNDFARLERDGWDAYVGATRNLVATGVPVVLVSTDWVFDGASGGYRESDPPSPINRYGILKAAAEMVPGVHAVARIAAVQAAASAPRSQDAGFGYFVASLVRALRAGERFTVWEGDINMVATPTLAEDAAALIARIVAGGHAGIFHCCGADAVDRRTLALRTVEEFGLDDDLLSFGPAPPQPWPVPRDTSLDAAASAAALGVELPDLDTQLRRLDREVHA